MCPLWNLFDSKGGGNVGEAEGETKEEIERLAREELGQDVKADAKRERPEVPEKKGWWNS